MSIVVVVNKALRAVKIPGPSYPSVIAECGFLSNPEEEAMLLTEEYRDKIAYAIIPNCELRIPNC